MLDELVLGVVAYEVQPVYQAKPAPEQKVVIKDKNDDFYVAVWDLVWVIQDPRGSEAWIDEEDVVRWAPIPDELVGE